MTEGNTQAQDIEIQTQDVETQAQELEGQPVNATVWKKAALVKDYLGRVRKGVPMAEAQIDVMMRVIEGRRKPVHNFLDLGCGDGILAATILTENPDASGVLVDFSMPMIQAALRNLKEYSQALHLTTLDYGEPSWFDTVATRGPFDVIVSGYSIHHQPDVKKQQIYADIFDLLKPEGIFVNMEHVASATPWVESLHDEFFIDALWAGQLTESEAQSREKIAELYHNREDKDANILASVERQCSWLRQIGFQDVDCYFKAFELAVFGGRRPLEVPIGDEEEETVPS